MSPTPQVASGERKDGDPRVLQLAASSSKLWTFPTDRKILNVWFMSEPDSAWKKKHLGREEYEVSWSFDPRISYLICGALRDWEDCTGISFQIADNPEQAHIRVAFGCDLPSINDMEWWYNRLTHEMEHPEVSHLTLAHLKAEFHKQYKMSHIPDASSWSYVGTDAKHVPINMPTMNLGFDCFQSFSIRHLPKHQYKLWYGTVLHEFGHALGFEHEGPHGVPYDAAKTIAFYKKHYGWSEAAVRFNVLEPAGQLMQHSGKVDKDSIMWYAVDPQMLDQSIPGWQDFAHGQNCELSLDDMRWAAEAYGFQGFESSASWEDEKRLDALIDRVQMRKEDDYGDRSRLWNC